MAGTDPSTGGGLLGLDPQLLASLGMGVMSAGRYGGNLGEGLMQGMQNYYASKQAQQNLQIGQFNLARQRALAGAADQLYGGESPGGPQAPPMPAPAASAPPQAGSPNGGLPTPSGVLGGGQFPPVAPQYVPPSPQAAVPQLPSWLAPPSAQDISSVPLNGMDPRALLRLQVLGGKDPIAASRELREQQLALEQQRYAPGLARLQTVVKSDKPSQYVTADPDLKAAWGQLAPQYGFDPKADFKDENVRTAFTFAHNALASSIGKEPIAPIVREQTVPRGVGGTQSTDPVTGKITTTPELETAQFIRNGQPVMMTKAEGIAQGLTPYNPTLFGAGNMTADAKDLAYQTWKSTGKLPITMSRSPAMAATLLNDFAARAKAEGDTGATIVANQQQVHARGLAEKSFAPGGQDFKTVQFLNTAVAHLATMKDLAQGLNNNVDSQTINRIKNAISREFGGTAPESAAAAAQIVGPEVVKAIVANGGSAAERDEIAKQYNNAKTWPQFEAIINTHLGLLGGQLETRRNSYQQTFGRNDFDQKFLTPRTRAALGITGTPDLSANPGGAHPPDIQAILKKVNGGG